ncbi:MAG: PAS domain S-box protein, partial [Azospirillaceae bacterium]
RRRAATGRSRAPAAASTRPGGADGGRPPAMAYRRAFEADGDARLLVEIGPEREFRCVDANEDAARFLEVPRDRLIGTVPETALPPDVAARTIDLLSRALAGTVQTDARRQRPDGEKRDYSVLARPIPDGRGRVRWIEVVVQDITESLRLRRERDDARSLLSSVFSAAQAGIIVADSDGRIIEVNDALLRTAGARRDDVVGRHFRSLVPPTDRSRAEALFPRLAAGEISGLGEWRLNRHDGGEDVPIVASAGVITRSDGTRCVVATVTDITEQKRLEEALRTAGEAAARANLAKTSFLASMSHELRTPLNAILGFTDILRGEMFGPLGSARYVDYAEDIHSSAEHLLALVNDLLDLSRIEAGALDLDEERVEPGQILGAARRMLTETAKRREIALDFATSPDLHACRGDERMLRQVMINLLGNALKYTERGGQVSAGAVALADGALLFLVRDTGSGIPLDRHAQALAPYGRVGPSGAPGSGSSGLGLPLAKAMVERHGGRLLLHSDTGVGTVMGVLLPAERMAPAMSSGAHEPGIDRRTDRRLAGIEVTSLRLDTIVGTAAAAQRAAFESLPEGVFRLDAEGRPRPDDPDAADDPAALAPDLSGTALAETVRTLATEAAGRSSALDMAAPDGPAEPFFDVLVGRDGTVAREGRARRLIVHLRGVPGRDEVLMFVHRLP